MRRVKFCAFQSQKRGFILKPLLFLLGTIHYNRKNKDYMVKTWEMLSCCHNDRTQNRPGCFIPCDLSSIILREMLRNSMESIAELMERPDILTF